jgi:hypothetical protein
MVRVHLEPDVLFVETERVEELCVRLGSENTRAGIWWRIMSERLGER